MLALEVESEVFESVSAKRVVGALSLIGDFSMEIPEEEVSGIGSGSSVVILLIAKSNTKKSITKNKADFKFFLSINLAQYQ
ncbi:hypothetical protein PRBRB14_21910 [Hallella multisaccharivorax DSM 17128]|nr:hypothetical protein PRBRB14_21910 [Hallella multisaccharivorax DSM 17128]